MVFTLPKRSGAIEFFSKTVAKAHALSNLEPGYVFTYDNLVNFLELPIGVKIHRLNLQRMYRWRNTSFQSCDELVQYSILHFVLDNGFILVNDEVIDIDSQEFLVSLIEQGAITEEVAKQIYFIKTALLNKEYTQSESMLGLHE